MKWIFFLLWLGPLAFGVEVEEKGTVLLVAGKEGIVRRIPLPSAMQGNRAYHLVVHPLVAGVGSASGSGAGGGSAGGGASAAGGSPSGSSTTASIPTPEKKPEEPPSPNEEPNPGKPREMNMLIYEANELYNAGKLDEAMELIDYADRSYPDQYQIKTMKGSLFFAKGLKEQAAKIWSESLKLNPNQPDVQEALHVIQN